MRSRLARERAVADVAISIAVGGGGGGISDPIGTAGGGPGGSGGSVTAMRGVSTRVVSVGVDGVVVAELGKDGEVVAELDVDDLAGDKVDVVVFPVTCV